MTKRNFPAAIALLFALSALAAESKEVIRTRWFDVIYAPPSAETAALVASRADAYAGEICALLGTEMRKRMPVYVESGVSILNAWFSPYPYDHIVLLDTLPTEGELAGNTDSILAVFYHELTHAISLSIRTPFWRFVSSVLGDFISVNSAVTMPLSFMEGATVSLESRGGEGRLADPVALHLLSQDKLEGRFLTWKEAAGALDVYPAGNSYYLYGGFFAGWLQKTYGMERYAEFWNRGAAFNLFTSYTQTRFCQTYGISLDEAWKRFEDSVPVPPGVRENGLALPGAAEGVQSLLDARSGRLVWLDLDAESIMLRDRDGSVRRMADADGTLNRLSLSPDGSELLVSRAVRSGADVTDRAECLDVDRGRYTGEAYEGFRDAAFLDGAGSIVAVRARGQRESLVTLSRGADVSTATVLLEAGPGGDRTLILNPVDSGTGAIACLSVTGTNRALLLVSRDGKTVRDAGLPASLRFIRYLSRGDRDGKPVLTFAWTGEGSFYRAAAWEPSSGALTLQEGDYSGGVFYPVWDAPSKDIAYVARLSGRTRVMELPSASRTGPELPLRGSDAGATGERSYRTPEGAPETGFDISPYSTLPWLFDGVFLPLPVQAPSNVSRATGNVLPGFLYITGAPSDRSLYQIRPAFSVDPFFVDFTLDGAWVTGPGTLAAGVGDRLRPLGSSGDAYRDLSASAGYTAVFRLTPSWNKITSTARFAGHWYGRASDLDGSLYGEAFASASYGTELTLNWEYLRHSWIARFPVFAVTESGAEVSANGWYGRQFPDGVTTRIAQGRIAWHAPFVPVSLEAAGLGSSGMFFGPVSTRTDAESARDFEAGVTRYVYLFPEYRGTDFDVQGTGFAASAQAELVPFTFEIQKGMPLFPVYANRLVLAGGYRAGWFSLDSGDRVFLDSGYARVSLQGAFIMGALSNVVLSLDAHYAQAIRRTGYDYGISFASSFSL